MYSILAFDNRSLESDVTYSNLDLETDSGMNCYQKLSTRMILQSLVAADESGPKSRISCIIVPISFQNVSSIEIDDTTQISFIQENLKSTHSILSHINISSDSWTGLFSNILKSVGRAHRTTPTLRDTPIHLTILTQDVALFGYKDRRRLDEASVLSFASELKTLKDQVYHGICVRMICFNISSSHEQDYTLDQLRQKTEGIIHRALNDMSTLSSYQYQVASLSAASSSVFSLRCMENAVVYYESVLRGLILSIKKPLTSKLIFPKTNTLEAFIEVELTPYSLSATQTLRPGLAKLHSVQFIPNTAIAAENVDGKAMLIRPVEASYTPKSKSNMIAFLALNRLLMDEGSVLLVRADVLTSEDGIIHDQYWALLPSLLDNAKQMTMLKLVDNEDLLQDGTSDSNKANSFVGVTAEEEMEIKHVQNGLKSMFLENTDIRLDAPYNPVIFNTKRFDSLIHASLRLATRRSPERSNVSRTQDHKRATKSKPAGNISTFERGIHPLEKQSMTKSGGASRANLLPQRAKTSGSNKKSTTIPDAENTYKTLLRTRTLKRRRAKEFAKSMMELSSSDDEDFLDEPR